MRYQIGAVCLNIVKMPRNDQIWYRTDISICFWIATLIHSFRPLHYNREGYTFLLYSHSSSIIALHCLKNNRHPIRRQIEEKKAIRIKYVFTPWGSLKLNGADTKTHGKQQTLLITVTRFMTHIRVKNNYSWRAERSDGVPCATDMTVVFCLTSVAI